MLKHEFEGAWDYWYSRGEITHTWASDFTGYILVSSLSHVKILCLKNRGWINTHVKYFLN